MYHLTVVEQFLDAASSLALFTAGMPFFTHDVFNVIEVKVHLRAIASPQFVL